MPLSPAALRIAQRHSVNIRSLRTAMANPSQQPAANGGLEDLDVGPLTIPAANPFVRPYKKDAPDKYTDWTAAQYLEATTAAVTTEAENKRRTNYEVIEVEYARDTHLATRNMFGRHHDDEVHRIADLYVARYGKLTDSHISSILREIPAVNTSNRPEFRRNLMNYSSDAQCNSTMFSRRAAAVLVDTSGGEQAWRDATQAQKEALVSYLFNQIPLIICKNHFYNENQSVNFDTIWAVTTDETEKFQKWHRSIFVKQMLTNVQHSALLRNATPQERKAGNAEIFAEWQTIKTSPYFDELGLGTVADLISRPSRSENDGRRLRTPTQFQQLRIL